MTLAEKVYFEIRNDIVRGALSASQPLRLDNLKQRYGAGFSPLREALNRLTEERLVTAAPLRGFVVSPISLTEMWDAIESRILIETSALQASIRHGDDDWEAQIVSSLHALTLQTDRLSRMPHHERQEMDKLETRHYNFHKSLISACRSDWLLHFSDKLYVGTERYRHPTLIDQAGQKHRNIQKEHAELAKAATERNTELAVELLTGHFRRTGDYVQKNFDKYFPTLT